MKLVFIINDIATEQDNYSTIRLTRRCVSAGIDVALVSHNDISYEADGDLTAPASRPTRSDYADDADLLSDLQSAEAPRAVISLTEVDVMMMRADPADDLVEKPWAHPSSLLFAQLVAERGVIVVNDPHKLTDASNKTYFQTYPASIRPRTCISRDPETILRFIEAEGGEAVIKPLQGSGGEGVFVIRDGAGTNVNQMIESTIRFGYAIVQEYLPAAADGDLRLLTLNGLPLHVDGVYACFRRFNETDDARSNISAGGSVELVEPDDEALRIARIAAPKLIQDGMYLAGLDIVGDKMMEINVDTPGGIGQAEDMSGVDFSGAVLDDLQHKVMLRDQYGGRFSNLELAMMGEGL